VRIVTEPTLVLGYGTYDGDPDPETGEVQPIRRSDGSPVEWVDFYDGEAVVRATVDRSLNGGRPAAGKTSALVLDMTLARKAAYSRGGREYVAEKLKLRLLGVPEAA
jgi:hypothetical protein